MKIRRPKAYTEIAKKIKDLLSEIKELKEKKKDLTGDIRVKCTGRLSYNRVPGCGKYIKINEYSFYDMEYYHKPYGCMGGDYTTHTHYELVCPDCGALTELDNKYNDLYYQSGKKAKKMKEDNIAPSVESRGIILKLLGRK